MSEHSRNSPEKYRSSGAVRRTGLAALALSFGASIGAFHFDRSEIETEIAATEVEISPTLTESYLTFQSGILPDLRVDSGLPIGLDIDIGNSTIPSGGMASDNGKRLVAAYAAVAAQPDAELQKISNLVKDQAYESLGIGIMSGLVPVAGYAALGRRRRQELFTARNVATGVVAASVAIAATGIAAAPDTPTDSEATWVPVQSVFPATEGIRGLEDMEIRDSAVMGIAEKLVGGIATKYEASKVFYDSLTQRVSEEADAFRTPEENQQVAIVVSDRHNNIGMDPVLRVTADAAGATILIDAGDDTSAGQRWEEFSLRSLLSNFEGLHRIAVGGNHDNDIFVREYFEEAGVTVPNGEVQTHEDIAMVLADDPRRSDYTPERREGEVTFSEEEARITELACNSDTRINLVVVHDTNMASEVLDAGCADLVVGGHTHLYAGPERILGENGLSGYTLTNGTSGGANFAITLGKKLPRDATATLVTFEEGRPVGVQEVTYTTTGSVAVGAYTALVQSNISDAAQGQHNQYVRAK